LEKEIPKVGTIQHEDGFLESAQPYKPNFMANTDVHTAFGIMARHAACKLFPD
jgi:hypothetical protein